MATPVVQVNVSTPKKAHSDKIPCDGKTIKGEPCKRYVDPAVKYCDAHNPAVLAAKAAAKAHTTPKRNIPKVMVQCKGTTIKNEPCQRQVDSTGNGFCPSHQNQVDGSPPVSKTKAKVHVEKVPCHGKGARGPCGRTVDPSVGYCWSHINQKPAEDPIEGQAITA